MHFVAICVTTHYTGSSNKPDYYEVLGVQQNATQLQIKKEYYKLAKEYHPDRNKGDNLAKKKFLEVSQAYDV